MTKDRPNALGIVSATYPANAKPMLTLTSHVALKNYAVDLSVPGRAPHVSKEELDYFLQPSRYVPTDGIVKETALKATAGATTEMEKARAIYDWVVDNTFRDPKVRGCGRGMCMVCGLPNRTWATKALDWRRTKPPRASIAALRYTFTAMSWVQFAHQSLP